MTGEIYIQPISAVGKKPFPLSPIFVFFFNIPVLFIGFFASDKFAFRLM